MVYIKYAIVSVPSVHIWYTVMCHCLLLQSLLPWSWLHFSYHQLSEDNFHSNCVAVSAGVCELDFFAMWLICIEGVQFCAKCMYITSFKYMQIAPER